MFYPDKKDGIEGMEQYSPENCDRAQAILDRLIEKLGRIGQDASETEKVLLFKEAVEGLNTLNEEIGGELIETGEREDLCLLFDKIAEAAGLDPTQYGEGGGIADEWRNW
jgi:hypothetical protein